MAEKKPSLTVLGGALAGTRFVLEGLGSEVLLGADPSCQLQLALTGVSAQHARLRVDAQGYTIEDAGSEHGLHVNDSRVIEATRLRNGDIVWLGTPGEADVVMLQCILPSRPVAAAEPQPAPASAAPPSSLSEDETLALALEQEGARGEAAAAAEEEPATGFYTAEDAASAEAPFSAEAPPAPFSAESPELVVAEDAPAAAASVPFGVDSAPMEAAPTPSFEDDTREQTYEFGEDPSTVVMASEMDAPPPPYIPQPELPLPATFVLPPEPDPTVALPPPPAPPPQPPKTQVVDRPVRAAAAAAPGPPSVAPRPPRPAPPPSSPAASIPGRRVARPAPPPPRDQNSELPPGAGPSSKTGLYAGIGIGILALVGVGLFAARKLRSGPPPVTVAEAPPTTVTPRPTAPPETLAEAAPAEVPPPVEAEPHVTPPPAAVPTPLAPTPAAATPPPTTLKPVPSPSPAAKKGAPTPPPPAATPTGPSPEQLRAQQVAGLLGQAESALEGGQYDQAIGHFDEVLRLDPGNTRATGERATAVSLRDAGRKTFVAGRTVVKTDKAAGGSIAGFEGAAVQKTPDFSGRIEFEMSPASGLKPGDAWTLRLYLVNDGKKAIKVGGVTANTVLNGAGTGGPVAAGTKEVAPQQRALMGTLTGSWKEGTSSWVADVLVTANKGDTLKNTLTWR